jgi:glutaredoxin 3
MPNIVMYTTASCPYCLNAERLLLSKGVKEINKIRVDLQPELRVEMMQKTGRRTVPQIYIGEQYIGGFDDLRKLDLTCFWFNFEVPQSHLAVCLV